jgi:hypothetical protein
VLVPAADLVERLLTGKEYAVGNAELERFGAEHVVVRAVADERERRVGDGRRR